MYRNQVKALTGLDWKSAHLLQHHAVKRSCCTAANPGTTGRSLFSRHNQPVESGFAAAQQLYSIMLPYY